MRYLLIILSFISFIVCEDIYPNFTDPVKQLKFEEKRIYTKKVENKEMQISGGQLLNFSLEPTKYSNYIMTPIHTNYKYNHSFEMKIGKEQITEIELLEIIGLDKEAEALRLNFNNKITEWEKNQFIIIKKPEPMINTVHWITKIYGICAFSTGFLGALIIEDGFNDNVAQIFLKSGLASSLVSILSGELAEAASYEFKKPIPKPIYNQQYSDEQLISISESYNKKIYEEIKNYD